MARRKGSRSKKSTVSEALSAAYRLLLFRDRSENELRKRLEARGFEKDVVDVVIARLKEDGFINDLEFAREFVRTKCSRGLSPDLIARKLIYQFGVDRETAEKALSLDYDEAKAFDAVRRLMRIKLKAYGEIDRQKLVHKVAAFATRRGFPMDKAVELAREVIKQHENQEE